MSGMQDSLPSPRSLWHPYKDSQPYSQHLQQSCQHCQMQWPCRRVVRTTVESRQGCILSPALFNIYIENIMSLALYKTIGVGVLVGGHLFNNL